MLIDLSQLSGDAAYFTMIQTIVPRPVAWVISDSGQGRLNLAPFSFFNAVSAEPALVMLGIASRDDGSPKDTWRNIAERDFFVIHIASVEHAPAVVKSAAPLPHGESEIPHAGLSTVPFDGFPLPRLKEAKVALACRREKLIEAGDNILILGRVEKIFLDDSIAQHDAKGRLKVDASLLDPLCRLGGAQFGSLGRIFEQR